MELWVLVLFYIDYVLLGKSPSISVIQFYSKKISNAALVILFWLVWLSGLSAGLQTKGSLVEFPIRTHSWIADQVPSTGHMRSNHTLTFPSLSFSFPSPFSKINKQIYK